MRTVTAMSSTGVFRSQSEHQRHREDPSQRDRFEQQAQTLDDEHQARLKQAIREHQSHANGPYLDVNAYNADRDRYYGALTQQAATLTPQAFYQALSEQVTRTHTHPLPYSPAQYLYPWVDLHPDGDLESIYSHQKASPHEAILADVAAHQAARPENLSNHAYNCEHAVPQSMFHKQLPERGDLHILYACDTASNSKRGNAKYGDLPGDPADDGTFDAAKNMFEPGGGKGAVARSTLYFLLRYPGELGDAPNEYNASDLATLLAWNRDYPVTDYEKHRNEEICKLQGNRNPLIDHPEWADKVDFSLGLGHCEQAARAA